MRRMSDVAPRRSMDMMRPQPAQRPVRPAQRPVRPAARPVVQQPASMWPQAPARPQAVAPKPKKRRRVLWVLLQFIIGLLVIAGVAAAIVMLYVRYYQ